MTPHFIELHPPFEETGETINMSIENIVAVRGNEIFTSDGLLWEVKETYYEIMRLISHAGCAIAKADPRADPRLDTSHWLTWDELTKIQMIGEPVFNSNSRKWMLLIDSDGLQRAWIELLNDAGGHERWTEHDAQKFPLYRMRKDVTWGDDSVKEKR